MYNMKRQIIKRVPFIITSFVGIAFVFAFYGKVLISPDNYMFSVSGDGIKNYFTFTYHIKYDSSYANFEGMNYPYGESILYTDCHPILANTIKFLSLRIPSLENYSVGLLNLFMIFSIILTFIILNFLLVELKFNIWFSIFFSFSIALLAPQLFRLEGHFALSYSMAIPLSWLLVLKCIKYKKTHLYVLLFINSLFWLFIHAYLGMIITSFIILILLINTFSDDQKKKNRVVYFWSGVAILLPIVFFYVYTILTDTHIGRTDNPSGFFLYNAEIDDVFLPHGKPFSPILNKLVGGIIKLEWEAWGYVGIVNTLFFVVLIVLAISSVFRKRIRVVLKDLFDNKPLNISLFAAFIVLLFAMAVPFKQYPKILEILPIFKQFRATGRFVWPFYFAFTTFAAYGFQKFIIQYFKNKKKIFTGIMILILIIGTTFTEALDYHNSISKRITHSPNLFKKELLPEYFQKSLEQINPNDYQAIISFPFYYQGSESYSRPRVDEAVLNSIVISLNTGLPNVCANLTRTSIEESKRIIQIVSPNYSDKKVIEDLSSNKSFLIVKTGNRFTQYEKAIIDKGRTIHKNDKFDLLQIAVEDLFSDDGKIVVSDFMEKKPNLLKQDSFYVSKYSSVLYYNGFEYIKSDTSYRGQGSYKSLKKGKNVLVEFAPNTFEKEKEYEVSMWMYNGEPDALNLWFRLIIEEYDEINNTWHTTDFFPEHAEVLNNNWSLVEGNFSIYDPNNRIYIVTKGKDNSMATLHIDDILVKENGIDVYKIELENNSLFFNNHKVSLK